MVLDDNVRRDERLLNRHIPELSFSVSPVPGVPPPLERLQQQSLAAILSEIPFPRGEFLSREQITRARFTACNRARLDRSDNRHLSAHSPAQRARRGQLKLSRVGATI